MASDDLLERIKAIAERNYPSVKDKLSSVDQVFVLKLSDGGSYVITLSNSTMKIEPGIHPKPLATLTTSAADLRAMLDGQMDAMKAFFQGKLQVQGDIFKTQVLNSLIKGAR
jgi:putative sterol carrier protein